MSENCGAEFRFIWAIENFNLCMHQPKEPLDSPYFSAMHNAQWYLRLYPRGFSKDGANIAGYIIRRIKDEGPESVTCGYELSFLGSVESISKSLTEPQFTFTRNAYSGFGVFTKRSEVFEHRRGEFLPHNTLTVSCRMWEVNPTEKEVVTGTSLEDGTCHGNTRIHAEHRTFTWNTELYALRPDGYEGLRLQPVTKEISPFYFKVLGVDDWSAVDKTIDIEISQTNIYQRTLLSCRMSAIKANGETVDFAEDDHVFEKEDSIQIWKFPSFLTLQKLLSNKSLHIPNGVLSIRCECAISNGTVVSHIQSIICGPSSYIASSINQTWNRNHGKEFDSSDILRNDLECLYSEEILCDVKLQTESKVFPAHKSILSARSPVFRAMFTGDMVEKKSDAVPVHGIEADTMQRMLYYIYTDKVLKMDWECAAKLFSAADRYSLIPLMAVCSSILKSNICTANAHQILVLAHSHVDSDLKTYVHDYILSQNKEFFNSQEWENFMKSDIELAAELMRLKITKK